MEEDEKENVKHSYYFCWPFSNTTNLIRAETEKERKEEERTETHQSWQNAASSNVRGDLVRHSLDFLPSTQRGGVAVIEAGPQLVP